MTLTKHQIDEFRKTIATRREALQTEIHGDVARARDETYGELAGPVVDTADESVATLMSDLDNAETSRDLNELRDLEAAQKRLDEGSYGMCVTCGQEIALERLRAVPGAARCMKCQQVHEKTYARQGEPKL
jgi:DnaK suppressor protein